MIENARFTRRTLLVLLLVSLMAAAASLQGNNVSPAVPDADDRCPVCGTLVAPHQAWLTQVRLEDGSTVFFEGAKDMFRYLQAPDAYSKDKHGVAVLGGFVTTWREGKVIPIEQAWYVIGSDVRGPAGDELVPHRSLVLANEFVMEHGGVRIVQAGDVSPSLLAQMP